MYLKKIIVVISLTFSFTNHANNVKEYFISINDSKIFVKELGSGEPLILLHGGPGLNHQIFMPYAEDLAKNYRVILYDQNDVGNSTSEEKKEHTANREIETLEAIRKELKINKLKLLGHSWGTILALMYAEKYPGNIDKITLISSIGTSFQDFMNFSFNAQARTAEELKKIQERKQGTEINQQDQSLAHDYLYFYHPKNKDKIKPTKMNFEVNNAIMSDISDTFNLIDKEKVFNFPILILQGESDLLSAKYLEQKFIKFPNVTIIEIEKSGHFPFAENPTAVNQNIIRFFNS